MRKLLLLLLLLAVSTSAIQAQSIYEEETTKSKKPAFQLGIKGGLNLNYTPSEEALASDKLDILGSIGKTNGYHAGLAMRLRLLSILYMSGDVMYVKNTTTYADTEFNMREFDNVNIDIPVALGLKLLFARIYAGPRFRIDANGSDSSVRDEFIEYFNSIERKVGFHAGVGINLSRHFSLDFSYNGRFLKPTDDNDSKYSISKNTSYYRASATIFF